MIGILSDAHGNFAAFRSAIRHLRALGAKSFYFLGDAVGYIPSVKVVEKLQSMGAEVKCILGNHEQMVLDGTTEMKREPFYQHQPVRDRLSETQSHFLKSWPTHRRETLEGTPLLFVHGSPADFTNGYVYPDTKLDQFQTEPSFVFMGHTHHPFIREFGGTTFVNVGSCGLPRDDGRYGSCAVFEPSSRVVTLYRFPLNALADSLPPIVLQQLHPSVIRLFERRAEVLTGQILSQQETQS